MHFSPQMMFGLACLILGLVGLTNPLEIFSDSRNPNLSSNETMPSVHVAQGRFSKIDRHALNAPPELQKDLQKLAAYLTEPAHNDTEKARAIYRWIAHNIAYDSDNYFKGKVQKLTAEKALESGLAVCSGYSNLFESLASLAGLESKTVRGITKGYSYVTTGKSGLITHAWNAVRIDGQWSLLDTAWGAGYLDGTKKSFVRNFKDYYFLTTPEEFVFDHFPNETRWQLLPEPLSKTEFNQLVYLRPGFFITGLKLGSHQQGKISTRNNPLVITLSAPQGNYISVRLLKGREKLPRDHVKLIREGELYTITTQFPGQADDYRIRVYAKQGLLSREFSWALDYQVSLQ